jgi:hypothetical protein
MARTLRLLLPALLAPALILAGCMSYPGDPPHSTTDLRASLTGANESPPNTSGAGGRLVGEYSHWNKIFTWKLYVNGLSSDTTWMFFHGPDGVGNDAAALVPINQPFSGNEHLGSVTLTEQQAADLLAGRWYVDIQTKDFPGGEIRGAVVPGKR